MEEIKAMIVKLEGEIKYVSGKIAYYNEQGETFKNIVNKFQGQLDGLEKAQTMAIHMLPYGDIIGKTDYQILQDVLKGRI